MSDTIRFILLLLATVGSGLIGGLFFIFSNTIMTTFDRLPNAHAIEAMQTLNAVILNPLFFLAFFGTAVICLILLTVAAFNWSAPGALYLILGSLIYLIGSIGVTMVCNVPLNNSLMAIANLEAAPSTAWMDYSVPWTWWNHIRTVASLISAALFSAALWQGS